jgi:hypothetical protein
MRMNGCIHLAICERILDHFKDNKFLSRTEFWKIYKGETENQSRRDLSNVFGGELDISNNDLVKADIQKIKK